ncbi:hypothetical protein GCM10010522_30640 [Kribbella solani]
MSDPQLRHIRHKRRKRMHLDKPIHLIQVRLEVVGIDVHKGSIHFTTTRLHGAPPNPAPSPTSPPVATDTADQPPHPRSCPPHPPTRLVPPNNFPTPLPSNSPPDQASPGNGGFSTLVVGSLLVCGWRTHNKSGQAGRTPKLQRVAAGPSRWF